MKDVSFILTDSKSLLRTNDLSPSAKPPVMMIYHCHCGPQRWWVFLDEDKTNHTRVFQVKVRMVKTIESEMMLSWQFKENLGKYVPLGISSRLIWSTLVEFWEFSLWSLLQPHWKRPSRTVTTWAQRLACSSSSMSSSFTDTGSYLGPLLATNCLWCDFRRRRFSLNRAQVNNWLLFEVRGTLVCEFTLRFISELSSASPVIVCEFSCLGSSRFVEETPAYLNDDGVPVETAPAPAGVRNSVPRNCSSCSISLSHSDDSEHSFWTFGVLSGWMVAEWGRTKCDIIS